MAVKEKGLEFRVIEKSKLPANIYTDTDRLKQCLINLAGNAIKFTETGFVHVNVSSIDKNNVPFICFDVEDTGIGMAAEKQEKIFEPFCQADGSTTRVYGGTGLGLSITKQFAELLGGEVSLTSKEGKGSVFTLLIPVGMDITEQPMLDQHETVSHTNTGKNETEQLELSGHILVAEDVQANQMLIRLILERMGLEVTIANNGKEVVQQALARNFDLILMDIQMPEMNGYQATEALRKEKITTPIIALTAYAMRGDDKKCIEAGCDGYLSKPVDRIELAEVLGKHLSSKELVSKH